MIVVAGFISWITIYGRYIIQMKKQCKESELIVSVAEKSATNEMSIK